MADKDNSKQKEKKGFFGKLMEKLDKKMEEKAKQSSCCGGSIDSKEKDSSCC